MSAHGELGAAAVVVAGARVFVPLGFPPASDGRFLFLLFFALPFIISLPASAFFTPIMSSLTVNLRRQRTLNGSRRNDLNSLCPASKSLIIGRLPEVINFAETPRDMIGVASMRFSSCFNPWTLPSWCFFTLLAWLSFSSSLQDRVVSMRLNEWS